MRREQARPFEADSKLDLTIIGVMAGLRGSGAVVRGGVVFVVTLVLGTPLLGSCGGTSRNGTGNASGSAGSNSAGHAGALTGGAPATGGSSSGAGAHAGGTHAAGGTQSGGTPAGGTPAGGRNAAGDSGFGGTTELGGTAGAGGAGGAPGDEDGWPCGDQRCSVGQTCIRCLIQNQSSPRCVPNPDQDPTAYASATAACEAPPFAREDCDGPEDCPTNQYCVANQGARCQNQPSTQHFCCFACNAITNCTLCHSNQDCPAGETCEPNEVADSKGCRAML